MQRKQVHIPCKDKQLSGFKETGSSESGSKGEIAFPAVPRTLWKKILCLCDGLIAVHLFPSGLCIAHWGKWLINQSWVEKNLLFLFSFSEQFLKMKYIYILSLVCAEVCGFSNRKITQIPWGLQFSGLEHIFTLYVPSNLSNSQASLHLV